MSTQPTPPPDLPELTELRDDWTFAGTDAPETKPEKPETHEGEDLDEVSKAASTLGKKGGQAAAEKRAKEAKEAEKAAKAKPETETADEESEETVEADKEKAGNPRHDRHARMLEATRKEAEAKKEAAAERAKRQELERELAALRKPPTERTEPVKARPQADEDPEPNDADFPVYRDYEKALARWTYRQERKAEREAEDEKRRAEAVQKGVEKLRAEFTEKHAKFKERIAETIQSTPDFWKRVSPEVVRLETTVEAMRLGKEPTSENVVADEIFGSEQGPALMLYFTDHPQDLQRLAALETDPDIVREVARIEARLGAATAGVSPKPRESKPNPPLRPVSGSANTADSEPDENTSYDDYVRIQNAKERRRR